MLNASFEWLVTVMSAMHSGKVDKTGKISMKRFMEVLKVIRADLTPLEVSEIGSMLRVFDENDNKLIYYYDFLASIKALLSPVEEMAGGSPNGGEPSSPPSPEAEALNKLNEFPSPVEPKEDDKAIEEKKEESQSPKGKNEGSVENEQSATQDRELNFRVAELDERWCEGDFSVVINRCHDCHLHKDYSRHCEAVTSARV